MVSSQPPEDDGLCIPEVGPWAKRKYHFLGRYLQMFSQGMKDKWPERHYIDLFASAGLARVRGTNEIVRSSALIAATVPHSFTSLQFCEKDERKASALTQRLDALGVLDRARVLCGDVNQLIDDILSPVPDRRALNVVFADPYGLHLDFETVGKIAAKRCDLIILLADNMDALRNWGTYYAGNPDSTLDRFMGESGWRELLLSAGGDRVAQTFRERYQQRLQELGYSHFAHERVKNTRGADIYTLLFASRHPMGLKYWSGASTVDEGGQRRLW